MSISALPELSSEEWEVQRGENDLFQPAQFDQRGWSPLGRHLLNGSSRKMMLKHPGRTNGFIMENPKR